MSWDHIDPFGMYDHSRKQQWHSTTDTEKAALERRIDELCEQVEHDRQTSRSRLERIDQLKAENAKFIVKLNAEHIARQNVEVNNAKLRELARQMYPYAKAHLQLGVTLGCNDTLSYDWALQMAELGIEVPE